METDRKWYLPKAETFDATGPLSTEQVRRMLKNNEITIDSFIWNYEQVEERWVRIFECKEFQEFLQHYPKCKLPKRRSRGLASQVIRVQFKNTGKGEYGNENNYRRYPRAPIYAKAIVHNQNIFREALCVDISEKGVLVEVDDLSIFKEGDEVVLTLVEHEGLGTFSVTAVIIHKITKSGKNMFGLFFLKIAPQLKRRVAEYVISQLEHESNKKAEEIA